MFSIPITNLKADEGAPFPIYLFLKRNNKFIPLRLPGDPLGREKYDMFLRQQHKEIWIPVHFREIYHSYLEYLQRTGHPIVGIAEVTKDLKRKKSTGTTSAEAVRDDASSAAKPKKSKEASLVRDALEDKELSREEKAEVLAAVSQDLLRAINQITTRGEEAQAEGMRRCKEIVDEIVSVAAQDSNIYDEILALRNSQEDFEHSVMVGTIAAMFALGMGYTDDKLLADIAIAALFHDIGLTRVSPNIVSKPEPSWSVSERKEYQKHVQASVDLLKESGVEFHPRVLRMISEHHENYDGSGFPTGIRGAAIDESSQILHLANLFDRICTGKQTGAQLSPAEAFDFIYIGAENPRGTLEVQPELVQRIFQFMLTEKESADALKREAERQVRNAIKENL